MRAGQLISATCLVTSALFCGVLSRPILSVNSAETDVHVAEILVGHEPQRLASLEKDDPTKPKAVAIAIRDRGDGGYNVGLIKMEGEAGEKGWHFPRGKFDKFDKDTHDTARRELEEETGYIGVAEKDYVADWDRFIGEPKQTKDQKKKETIPYPKRLHGHFVTVSPDQIPTEGLDAHNREFKWFPMERVAKTLGPREMKRIWAKVYPRLQKPDFMKTFKPKTAEDPKGIRLDPSQPESPRRWRGEEDEQESDEQAIDEQEFDEQAYDD